MALYRTSRYIGWQDWLKVSMLRSISIGPYFEQDPGWVGLGIRDLARQGTTVWFLEAFCRACIVSYSYSLLELERVRSK